MGTICILLGIISFIASIFTGFIASNAIATSPLAKTFVAIPTGTEMYIAVVGVCAFIGLLICINLVMLGLTYNKVSKLKKN